MRKNIKKMAAIGISGLLSAGLLVGSVDYASHMFSMNNEVVWYNGEYLPHTVFCSSHLTRFPVSRILL